MEKPLWERDSFFKIMIGDFQTSLRIPPCFQKHLSGEIMVKSVLRSRYGRRWAVMLKREGNSLFFREGWECFVADLAIQLGELLLFVYDGDLGFDVKIYGITGCEKEDPIVTIKEEQEEEEERERGEVPAKTSTRFIRAQGRRREILNGHIILGGLKVFGNERALMSARSFKSSRPFFIATCRSSRQEYMTIPVSFMRECDLGKMEAIILQDQKGRSWPVRVAHWIGRVAMAKGWTKFREVNHLKEGDVCVFEFLEVDKAIHVHIFRAMENTATVLRTGNKKREEEVLKAERSFRPDARFASTFLKSRKYTLNIPSHVLRENDVTKISKTTLRDPCGRSWSVDIKHRLDGRAVLGRGWFHFCRENHLQENDICIFEFSGGIQVMDVQIRRVGLRAITAG